MVKGTSHQVIVVHAPEEKLFDQAIFILRDSAAGVSDEVLLKEARGYLDPPYRQKRKKRHNGPLWAAAGAGITGAAWLLSVIL